MIILIRYTIIGIKSDLNNQLILKPNKALDFKLKTEIEFVFGENISPISINRNLFLDMGTQNWTLPLYDSNKKLLNDTFLIKDKNGNYDTTIIYKGYYSIYGSCAIFTITEPIIPVINNIIKEDIIMSCKNKYQKSSARTYNSTTQTVTATTTQINLLGSTCSDTGCSLTPNTNSISVNNSGLYYIAADVTFTPTAAGTEIVQLYKDSTALPCAVSQTTAVASTAFTTHVETVLPISTCCAIQPQFSVRVGGVAGGVNFVGMTIVKLA